MSAGVDWNDLSEAYAELLKAKDHGRTAILMRLSEMQCALSEALDAAVIETMQNAPRASWQAIGDALGVTRQAASKRWSEKLRQARR